MVFSRGMLSVGAWRIARPAQKTRPSRVCWSESYVCDALPCLVQFGVRLGCTRDSGAPAFRARRAKGLWRGAGEPGFKGEYQLSASRWRFERRGRKCSDHVATHAAQFPHEAFNFPPVAFLKALLLAVTASRTVVRLQVVPSSGNRVMQNDETLSLLTWQIALKKWGWSKQRRMSPSRSTG